MSNFPSDGGYMDSLLLMYIHATISGALIFLTAVAFFGIFFGSSFGTLRVDFPELNATSLSNIFKTDDNDLNQQLSSLFGSLTTYLLQPYSGQRIYSHLFCFAQVDVDRDDISYGCAPLYGFKVGYFIERLVPYNFKEPMLTAYHSISLFNSIRQYGNFHMILLWVVKFCLGIPMFINVYLFFYGAYFTFEDEKSDRKAYKYIIINAILFGTGSFILLLSDLTIMLIVNKYFTDLGFHASLSLNGNLLIWMTFLISLLQIYVQYKVLYGFDRLRAAMEIERQKARNGEYNDRQWIVINGLSYKFPPRYISEFRARRKEERNAEKINKSEKKAEAQARKEEQREAAKRLKAEREAEKQATKERQDEERKMRLEEEGRLKAVTLEQKQERERELIRLREFAQAEKEAERIRMRELAEASKQAKEEERKKRERERAFAKGQAHAEAAMIAEAKAIARAERNKPAYTQDDIDNDTSSFYAVNEIRRYQESVAYPKSARTKSTGYPQSYEPSRRAR